MYNRALGVVLVPDVVATRPVAATATFDGAGFSSSRISSLVGLDARSFLESDFYPFDSAFRGDIYSSATIWKYGALPSFRREAR